MTIKRFFRCVRVGFETLLRIPFVNWFNPFLTLYLNFRSFPFGQAVKMPLFVYGWPKFFSLLGEMECKCKCRMGMIKFNSTNVGGPDHPGLDSVIDNWGKVIFYGPCTIHTGVKISVRRFATLELGPNVHIMPNCIVSVWDYVHIGENTRVSHRCQIMDSNYHYIADVEKRIVRRRNLPIYIGDSVWICNSATISAGSRIPSFTIVASHSLVNKDLSDVSEGSIIGGSPAKLIKSHNRRIFNYQLECLVDSYFRTHPQNSVYLLDDGFDENELV